jgi:hypothetical protein
MELFQQGGGENDISNESGLNNEDSEHACAR